MRAVARNGGVTRALSGFESRYPDHIRPAEPLISNGVAGSEGPTPAPVPRRCATAVAMWSTMGGMSHATPGQSHREEASSGATLADAFTSLAFSLREWAAASVRELEKAERTADRWSIADLIALRDQADRAVLARNIDRTHRPWVGDPTKRQRTR